MTVAECKKIVFPWVYKLFVVNSQYKWYDTDRLPETFDRYVCVTCDAYKVDSFKRVHWGTTIPTIPQEAEFIYVYRIRKEDFNELL